MNKQVTESWNRIKQLITEREIEPCPRMNTDACTHSEFSDFPDPETLPMSFDVAVLLRCDRCIFRER